MNCRLLYLVGKLRAGGLERQLSYLLATIERRRYTPAVAVWNFREDDFYVEQLHKLEIPIYYPPHGTPGGLKLDWFRSLVCQLRPEVIHSYSFYTNFPAWFGAGATDAVTVGSVRSEYERAMSSAGFLLGRLCARWPRIQIFNSIAAAETATASYSAFKPRQVVVVRNGIDLERFEKRKLTGSCPPTVIAIGSLTPVKRWDRLLNAAFKLKQMEINCRVRIVGDGPLRKPLERQAGALGITDFVEFVGQRHDVPALLSDALLLAHTSQSEGCPNVVMEAMACGLPVVATDAGDVPFLVDDGKTGFVVRQGDSEGLAERIAILIRNQELCEQMSIAARLKAEREFGFERVTMETFAAYRNAGWGDRSSPIRKREPLQERAPGITISG